MHAYPSSRTTPPSPDRIPLPPEVKVVNNVDWYSNMKILDFLKGIGRFARVPQMLSRDSVKARLQPSTKDSYEGLSYTEFTYQLLQAYDFYYLHQMHDCSVQLGGSDQWGNITAGTDLIRRKTNGEKEAFGVTLPLVVNAQGEKFGKSAGNAIWLDEEMCSVFDFYQVRQRASANHQIFRRLHPF